jgi:hypothetical protein
VLGTTLAASLVAAVDPALAGSTPPHAALTGNLDDWTSIVADNSRVLAAPFLLWLLGMHNSRVSRQVGDAVVLVVIAVNAIPVGIALGRWQSRLIPYVPQLPLEWAALILAVSAWLTIRTTTATRHRIAGLAASTAVLVLTAAALETWATPHRPAPVPASRQAVDAIPRWPLSCGGPGVDCATDFAPARPGRCKVARSLPLTLFGSARPKTGADRATSTTPGPPQGGTTT